MKTLVVDLARCNGCFNCQLACKDEHCGNDWNPIALSQPETGQFWCRIDQRERGRVPVVRVAYTPVFCGMCDDAPCLKAAENDAVYRRDDGIVIIDPEKAKGQKALVDACPAGLIFWNEQLQVPQKCTGCAHLLDDGWEEPRCVDACGTGALRLVDEADLANVLMQYDDPAALEQLADAGSHVIYVHRPKRWIAGTVADRSINEVIVGARVSIYDAAGNLVAEIKTDEFGDFKYDDCEKASYKVHIDAKGYAPIDLEADCTDCDIVFDDIFVKE